MASEKQPDNFYQTVNFYFSVMFSKNSGDRDIKFQSVTGLDSTLDTETIKEGGENRFEHVIPMRRKYGPLILKRGLLDPTSNVTIWLQKAFDHQEIEVIPSLEIHLLGDNHDPIMKWIANNVWPRSWKIGELNAERGEVLIETLELNCNYLRFQKTP